MADENSALVVFQGKNIRRKWHEGEWFFSIVDIIEVLTDSSVPRRYWSDFKTKLNEEGSQLYGKIVQLKLPSTDGKSYETDCANTENMFRIIQSIPSPKAEPFKLWLAKVGYERVQEIENPELAQNRARDYYELKGYPKDWVEKRLRGIAIRQELTNEWKNRGVGEQKEYAILTNEISQATFGVPVQKHKEIKDLNPKFKNQNLRDHMTDLELIFSMLGERLTTETTRKKNSQGFKENLDTAREGGTVAGRARKDAEKTLGIKVVSTDNYLSLEKEKIEKKKVRSSKQKVIHGT
ncbi:MAG TPA: Bro-N domain-containing protein [Candidatus Nanoarchaeia archaeon]|nr:Bro-N domain-containing protein [Candidatus Nanoarchaeia archaeon]